MANAVSKVNPFLMFFGQAKEAITYYTSLFDESEVTHMLPNEDGTVMHATLKIKGQTIMCIDSALNHNFTFTPAMSLFVTCDTAEEFDRVYSALSEGGAVMVPASPTPVSEKFAWVNDKFGVSWQLNLPKVG
jgi:predicted 3-demethylubiquinone-9 3-methyltransferase (glyoxalase superfamily)